jgi:hypothetical protein
MQGDEALCLDAMVFGNVAQFLNHRCEDANLLDMFMQIETHNPNYYHENICLPLHTLEFLLISSNSPTEVWLSHLLT